MRQASPTVIQRPTRRMFHRPSRPLPPKTAERSPSVAPRSVRRRGCSLSRHEFTKLPSKQACQPFIGYTVNCAMLPNMGIDWRKEPGCAWSGRKEDRAGVGAVGLETASSLAAGCPGQAPGTCRHENADGHIFTDGRTSHDAATHLCVDSGSANRIVCDTNVACVYKGHSHPTPSYRNRSHGSATGKSFDIHSSITSFTRHTGRHGFVLHLWYGVYQISRFYPIRDAKPPYPTQT